MGLGVFRVQGSVSRLHLFTESEAADIMLAPPRAVAANRPFRDVWGILSVISCYVVFVDLFLSFRYLGAFTCYVVWISVFGFLSSRGGWERSAFTHV